MIKGIGIDIVQVQRMERWRSIPGLLERFFHPQEIAAVKQRGPAGNASLAARFAAKEAFGKALGTGLTGIVLKEVMVINESGGRPAMQVLGTALNALEKSGANKIHVSLAHERDNAVAMVILEEERNGGRS